MPDKELRQQIKEALDIIQERKMGSEELREKTVGILESILRLVDGHAMAPKEAYDLAKILAQALVKEDKRIKAGCEDDESTPALLAS